jgi:hypothetical protein
MSTYGKPDVNTVSIVRFVEQAVNGEIDIPEFQREFVWTKDQVKELLDSLIKGYPVGSFIVWDLSQYTTGKHVYEKKRKEWIVDGQQRIGSFCILSMKKPYWLEVSDWNAVIEKFRVKVNILTLEAALEYPAIKRNPEWLYAHEILSFPDVKAAAEDLSRALHRPELFTKIYDNVARVRDALSRDVPVVKISSSLEDIATIFERINSAGTRVKLADVTLAYLAAYNEGWIRDKFIKYLDGLNDEGFYFEPTLLVRALTSVGENKAVLRDVSEDFLRNKNGILDKSFERLKDSLNNLIQSLRSIGILSSELIYAKNTVIPVVYLHTRFAHESDFDKALHFFLLALHQGRYSGSAETTLQEDVNTIHDASNFADAIDKLHSKVNPIVVDPTSVRSAVHYQGEGRFLKLVLYLIAHRNSATDWFSKIRLGYLPNNEVNKDFSIEEHHFFPRGLLRSVGVEEEQRESLANITFINPGTNKRLRDEPYMYIKRFAIDKGELEKQTVPVNDEGLWKLSNYDRFMEKRASLISAAVNDYLRNLYSSFYTR